METLDNRTHASDPGQIRLSREKLRRFHPVVFWPFVGAVVAFMNGSHPRFVRNVEEHLLFGDSRAALVVQRSPLLIAAYTDELDAVVMLRFPEELAHEYRLETGTGLLTVNIYWDLEFGQARDLEFGSGSLGRYGDFAPLIAEFLSDDTDRIEARKAEIDEAEWQRTRVLADAYRRRWPGRALDGRPLYCGRPA